MACSDAAAVDVELAAVYGAQRRIAAQLLAAVLWRFPGLECGQHLRRKGFVDLVVIEVLQGQAGIAQHGRDRQGRCHQQAFAATGKVHGPSLAVGQIGQHRQLAAGRKGLAAQQDGGGAIGQRGAVAGGQRAGGAAVKGRLEFGQFGHRGVGAHVVVLGQTQIRHDQVFMKTAGPGRSRTGVAGGRQLILLFAADLPAARHQFGALSHGQASARFDDTGHFRLEHRGSQ